MDQKQELIELRTKLYDLEQRFQSDLKDHWKMMADIVQEIEKISKKVRK